MTVYISVDVETAALVPKLKSLLSVGACTVETNTVGFKFHEVMGGTKTVGVDWDGDTYNWWNAPEQTAARDRLNSMAPIIPYEFALLNTAERFYDWIRKVSPDEQPIFVGWPASFDYPFIQFLFKNAALQNPFNYRTLDVKSYACGMLNVPINCERGELPDYLFEEPEFPHDALSDATAQAKALNKLFLHNAASD